MHRVNSRVLAGLASAWNKFGVRNVLKISNHYVSKIASALLLIEIGILIASAYLAAAVRFSGDTGFFRTDDHQFFPSAMASRHPGASATTTALPVAAASMTTFGRPSR